MCPRASAMPPRRYPGRQGRSWPLARRWSEAEGERQLIRPVEVLWQPAAEFESRGNARLQLLKMLVCEPGQPRPRGNDGKFVFRHRFVHEGNLPLPVGPGSKLAPTLRRAKGPLPRPGCFGLRSRGEVVEGPAIIERQPRRCGCRGQLARSAGGSRDHAWLAEARCKKRRGACRQSAPGEGMVTCYRP